MKGSLNYTTKKAMTIMTAAFVSLLLQAQVGESSLMFLQNVPVFRGNRI